MKLPEEINYLNEVLSGKKNSFRFFVDKYYLKVLSYIKTLVPDKTLAEDLLQETFLRAYSKLSTFDQSREFAPWIIKLAHNIVLKQFRKSKTEISNSISVENFFQLSEKPENPKMVDEKIAIDRSLEKLTLGLKIVFLMKHSLGFTYEEISEILEEPLGTIKVSVFRACSQMRKELEELREVGQKSYVSKSN
ncbi:MAG: RNA polymerase sigma factor [Candidatus Riflebacteria bacterium]|nr:RNA polymerase sigma factor [Candidatus Riflebacteria bacterium]